MKRQTYYRPHTSKHPTSRVWCLITTNWSVFIICLKLLPLLSGGAAIFKLRRMSHRPVTLHGDTAGSRGVCSLLLDSSRKTRTRIYGCSMRMTASVSLLEQDEVEHGPVLDLNLNTSKTKEVIWDFRRDAPPPTLSRIRADWWSRSILVLFFSPYSYSIYFCTWFFDRKHINRYHF